MQSLMKMGREDDTTMVNVSVAIWFTKEFAAIENDVQGYGFCGQLMNIPQCTFQSYISVTSTQCLRRGMPA